MAKQITSEAQFEAMMERCRQELLNYQRATAPGREPLTKRLEKRESSESPAGEPLPPPRTASGPRGTPGPLRRGVQTRSNAGGGAESPSPFFEEELPEQTIFTAPSPGEEPKEICPPAKAQSDANFIPDSIRESRRRLAQFRELLSKSVPSSAEEPAEVISAPEAQEEPAVTVSAPEAQEEPAAAVSAPEAREEPAATVSVPEAREEPAVTVSVPEVQEEPAATVSVPEVQEEAAATVSVPEVQEEPAATVSVPEAREEPAVTVSVPEAQEEPAVTVFAEGSSFASQVLPLVQEAVEQAARQALPETGSPVETFPVFHGRVGRICGAAGLFTPAPALAQIFPDRMEKTGARMRFTAFLNPGAPDAARCQRCLCAAIDGWDAALPAFLTPVSFTGNETLRARFEQSALADPESGLCSPEFFWETVCAAPESLLAVRHLYSDRGTPASWRAVEAFTPPLVWDTAQGRLLARCRFSPSESARPLSRLEAEELCGADSDALTRDLWLALKNGERPVWSLFAQLVSPKEELCDPAVLWEEEEELLLGTLTLTRNVPVETVRAWRMAARAAKGTVPHRPNAFADLTEAKRRLLAENLVPDLQRLPAGLLERVLMLFSKEDLALGQMLTSALEE